jgi:hypothetical protein
MTALISSSLCLSIGFFFFYPFFFLPPFCLIIISIQNRMRSNRRDDFFDAPHIFIFDHERRVGRGAQGREPWRVRGRGRGMTAEEDRLVIAEYNAVFVRTARRRRRASRKRARARTSSRRRVWRGWGGCDLPTFAATSHTPKKEGIHDPKDKSLARSDAAHVAAF